jgi:hypothetical protein
MSTTMTDLIEGAEAFARDWYKDNEEMLPLAHLLVPEGPPIVITFVHRDEREKSRALEALRMALRETSARAYMIMSEAWTAEETDNTPQQGRAGFVQPSRRPDRQEVLLITIVERAGPKCSVMYAIERDGAGAVTAIKHMDTATGGEVQGRVLDLFEPEGVAGRA